MRTRYAAALLAATTLHAADRSVAQSPVWSEQRVRAILAPPTDAEIEAVRGSWPDKAPATARVEVVERGSLERDGVVFEALVYRHRVAGEPHYTAVFVPAGAEARSLPVLVETRGVRFDYPIRRIVDGPFVMSLLGDLLDDFVIVEPCLRGHGLQAIEATHRAGGERRDSWDGATEDVMAALSVAIEHVPAADGRRVATIGLSRGGGVALLHGARDSRVSAVVAMSAPTDWFSLMARPGDADWPATIHEAATNYDGPEDDRASQFYEWFLQDRESLPDAEIRRRLIASSPLHYASLLPPTIVHHGSEDPSVPSGNAAALNDRFVALDRPRATHRVIIHEGAGHLLRGSPFAEQIQAFLGEFLGLPTNQ